MLSMLNIKRGMEAVMKKVTIEGWQIAFKDGRTMEFLSYDVAKGYAEMFHLQPPCRMLIQ
jgi:hypothetical protein